MFELIENNPPVSVQESEYQRLLGYPKNHTPTGRSRELADAARQWFSENGRPWIHVREIDALKATGEQLIIGGEEFSSRQLRDSFAEAQAHSAMLVAVSAGRECEERARQLWQEARPDEYFFLEVLGSAVVEHLVTVASGRICSWADQNGMAALPHYSPGYSGWDIAEQTKLWALIRQNSGHDLPGALEVMETGMLRPKKSLLAVIGVTRDLEKARRFARLIPCEGCSLSGCRYRRAPYKHALPQIEDIHRLQNSRPDDDRPAPSTSSVLTHNAKYSINVRALKKWSRERLRLEFSPTGQVSARFRYEGTTCSNMGRPLEFDYHVELGTAAENYKITGASCAPSPDDTGNAYQCEYLNDAVALMRSLADEKPLLGRPLDDVLTWQRAYDPSGCFCNAARREHKWGLALEVIHFALALREQELANGQMEKFQE